MIGDPWNLGKGTPGASTEPMEENPRSPKGAPFSLGYHFIIVRANRFQDSHPKPMVSLQFSIYWAHGMTRE